MARCRIGNGPPESLDGARGSNHRRMLAHMFSKAERDVAEAEDEEDLQGAREELNWQILRQHYLNTRAIVILEPSADSYILDAQERRWNSEFRHSERLRRQWRIGSAAASAEAAALSAMESYPSWIWTRSGWIPIGPTEAGIPVEPAEIERLFSDHTAAAPWLRATRSLSTSLMHQVQDAASAAAAAAAAEPPVSPAASASSLSTSIDTQLARADAEAPAASTPIEVTEDVRQPPPTPTPRTPPPPPPFLDPIEAWRRKEKSNNGRTAASPKAAPSHSWISWRHHSTRPLTASTRGVPRARCRQDTCGRLGKTAGV